MRDRPRSSGETLNAAIFRFATLFCAVALLMGVQPISPAYAQSADQSAAPVFDRIADIVVRGNERIETDTVLSYVEARPGDPFAPQLLDVSLKTLFRTGLFADVNLEQRGATLVVTVRENPIINRVLFEGNSRLKDDKFTEEIELAPRIVYTRAKVQSDVRRIIELYRQAGRFSATVEPKVVQLPQNRVDLVFEIDEGPKTGVAKINFVGNTVFNDSQLRSVVVTKESRWYNFLTSNDNYDPGRVEFDQEQLRNHYRRNGYADFQVSSAVAELTPDRKKFFITYNIDEGTQYKVGSVSVRTSLEKLNEDAMRALIPIQEGDIFNAERIEDSIESLTFAAGVVGYAFVQINDRTVPDRANQTIDLVFEMNEGPRVYVERINIGGNFRTLDKVIRREMRLSEGDAFNRVLVDRSRVRVQSLGFFNNVEISEEPGTTPDRTVLDVQVEERSTGSFSIGAGFSSNENFIADLSIEERNLLGRGQFLRLRLSFSSRQRQVELRFSEPYFLDRNLAAGFDIFSTNTDFREAGFESDTIGFGLNLGFAVSEYSRLNLRYSLRNDDIFVGDRFGCDIPENFAISPICQSAVGSPFLTSSIGYTFSYSTIDNPLEPSRGRRVTFSQDLAGIGGSVNYIRTDLNMTQFKSIPRTPFVGMLRGTAGYIDGWGGDDVRLNDRFYRGGTTFRGFEIAGVGPRDFRDTTNSNSSLNRALGAKLYAIGTAEIFFPLPLPEQFNIRSSVFTDFGAVGILDDSTTALSSTIRDDFSFRLSAGVSLSWDSPFGPIRIDIAEVFRNEEYDEIESFRFSAGTRF